MSHKRAKSIFWPKNSFCISSLSREKICAHALKKAGRDVRYRRKDLSNAYLCWRSFGPLILKKRIKSWFLFEHLRQFYLEILNGRIKSLFSILCRLYLEKKAALLSILEIPIFPFFKILLSREIPKRRLSSFLRSSAFWQKRRFSNHLAWWRGVARFWRWQGRSNRRIFWCRGFYEV